MFFIDAIGIKTIQAYTENRFTGCITNIQECLVLSGKKFHTPVLEDCCLDINLVYRICVDPYRFGFPLGIVYPHMCPAAPARFGEMTTVVSSVS